MHTPHDWRNGADYSDECYEQMYKTFDFGDFKKLKKFFKIFFIVLVLGAITFLFIQYWAEITSFTSALWNKLCLAWQKMDTEQKQQILWIPVGIIIFNVICYKIVKRISKNY